MLFSSLLQTVGRQPPLRLDELLLGVDELLADSGDFLGERGGLKKVGGGFRFGQLATFDGGLQFSSQVRNRSVVSV